ALTAALHVLSHALQVDVITHFEVVAPQVELQPLGIAAQLVRLQVSLVGEQQIMHWPELSLAARTFGRLRGVQGVRVDFFQRKIAKDEADASSESLEQKLDHWSGLLAVRAFEIPVLDERNRRMRRTDRVIGSIWRNGQVRHVSTDRCARQY